MRDFATLISKSAGRDRKNTESQPGALTVQACGLLVAIESVDPAVRRGASGALRTAGEPDSDDPSDEKGVATMAPIVGGMNQLSEAISHATAPAFMLGAVAGFLSILIARLERIVDRNRALQSGGGEALDPSV